MFMEVEQQIQTALKKAFQNYPEIKDNIYPVIGKENLIREIPAKMPAVRIVFMGSSTLRENDLTAAEFITELEYAVLLFFRSFKDKTGQNVYKYLQVIHKTLKGYLTTKGVLKPSKAELEVANQYYLYAYKFKLQTVF